jgi:hypothetical protein
VTEGEKKMSNQGKWIINLIEDGTWGSLEEFESKEEAISYGKKNFEGIYEDENGEKFDSEIEKKVFYVGQIERYVPSICVNSLVEQIAENAHDEVGEVAEDYLYDVSKEDIQLLEERLNDVLSNWFDETNNNPTFWKIVNIENVNA